MKKRLTAVLAAALLSFPVLASNVDVNRASVEELTALDGVGEVLAQRIVEEREAAGSFVNLEDLAERVPGIGPAFIEQNAERISVD